MNSIKKNATLNIIKQICMIIFPLITFPYATRILHAENYGMFTFASSIISYISLIAALGINNYAVREGARIRDDKCQIKRFANEIFTINIISTLIAFVILAVLMFAWRKLDPYAGIIIILASNVLFTTLGTDWINVIFEDYEYITKRYIFCQIIAVVLLFVLVKNQDDVLKYSFVTVVGSIIANIMNMFYIRKKYQIKVSFVVSKDIFSHLAPVMLLFANAVAVSIYIHSDTTILGILKTDYEVGIYGVASRVYIMVKQVANAAIYVIIPRVASLIKNNKGTEINNLYSKTLGSVMLIIIPAIVGLIMQSGNIIRLLAGVEYIDAIQPLIILACALIFATTSCLYINGVLIPYRREKIVLQLTIVSAVINIGLNIMLIPVLSYNAAALTTLFSEMLLCFAGLFYAKDICKFSIFRELSLGVASGVVVFISCSIVNFFVSNDLLNLTFGIGLSGLSYIILMCFFKRNFVYSTILQILHRLTAIRK